MGYTHYWYRPVQLEVDRFQAAVADCRKLCEALPIPLGNACGTGEPEFSVEAVSFNGSVHSESFSKDGQGLCWPTASAEGVAIAGTTAESGSWFAGPTLASRCVSESGDGSYESFVVEREEPAPSFPGNWKRADGTEETPLFPGKCFAFCKTNFRPYDLCVQCCLIVFKEHFGATFIVHSDGTDEQWNEARDACQVFLGYGLGFRLDNSEGGA